jgi:hypothetical protein
MAKQTGEYKITGTYDDVTYYLMEGQYYARKKSSLKGERVKRDKRFRRTMEWAQRMAVGSQLASKVYRTLPREEQVYALFCTLKSAAIRALKEGKGLEEVKGLLKVLVSTKDKVQGTRDKALETRHKGQRRGTKNEVQGTMGKGQGSRRETSNVRRETREKLRAASRESCTLYAARKGCMGTRAMAPAGERLFVDASGRLKDCGAGSKQARAHGP